MDLNDKLVSLTQAAQILGYKNYASILRLIDQGHLQTFQDSKGKANRLKYEQVVALAVPEEEFLAMKKAPKPGDSK